jgi:hypothetical protein
MAMGQPIVRFLVAKNATKQGLEPLTPKNATKQGLEPLTPWPFNQVWEIPQLWEGFVKCCRQTQPRSNEILLQLPPNRLADALSQSKDLADLLHK